ncbi:glycosyltransferase [Brevibacillus choshinensis]|uniref:glycosyltransferase n=1 Tax=Brevibacillus choshinensis TaxID=54911 RepID=UPI002E1CD1F8|nr:glycosyltransferase [Brevibacillus choshinensis]
MTAAINEYDSSYYQVALRQNQAVAILVVAYNRPEYLKEVIDSLAKNPESSTFPFYFFLDGGPGAKQEENITIIQQSPIVKKEIITRNRNYGCAKNLIDARRFLFDWCQYEKVIVVEDDIILSPHYIRFLLALHQWARKNFNNVGVVQGWSYCFLTREDKKEKLKLVRDSGSYWWSFVSYCLDQEVWQAISPILYEYETSFINKIPWSEEFYKERSKPGLSSFGPDIRSWVKQLIDTHAPIPAKEGKSLKTTFDLRAQFAAMNYDITMQDLMTGFALWKAGYVKLESVVNRARHIGKYGVTVDEGLFHLLQHDKITLDHFDEDRTITEFEEV